VKRIKLLTIAAVLALTVGTGQSATRDIYPDPAKAKGGAKPRGTARRATAPKAAAAGAP